MGSATSSPGRAAVPTQDPKKNDDIEAGPKEGDELGLASKALTFWELMVVLKPFFVRWMCAHMDG